MALPVLLYAIYLLAIRPAELRWGATAEEVARSMPGDDLVPTPSFCATRAITIHGRPEDIWPWLVQIGYGRAGFYGYDLIENLGSSTGIRSAGSILPELQHPKTGDVLPISAVASLVFESIQPERYLVWRGAATPIDSSFVWALYPIDASHTRLISRIRLRYHWRDRRLALDLFTEFGDHVAVPKILLGLKGRVEGRPPQTLAEEAARDCLSGFLRSRSSSLQPCSYSAGADGGVRGFLRSEQGCCCCSPSMQRACVDWRSAGLCCFRNYASILVDRLRAITGRLN